MRIIQVSESVLISGGSIVVKGYALKTGEDTEIALRNGDSNSAPSIIPILLGAEQSVRDYFEEGVPFNDGLYFDLVSGEIEGTVWVA